VLDGGVFERAATGDGLRHRAGHSGHFQFRSRSTEDRLRRAEAFQQLSGVPGSQTRNEFERQPVEFFFPAENR